MKAPEHFSLYSGLSSLHWNCWRRRAASVVRALSEPVSVNNCDGSHTYRWRGAMKSFISLPLHSFPIPSLPVLTMQMQNESIVIDRFCCTVTWLCAMSNAWRTYTNWFPMRNDTVRRCWCECVCAHMHMLIQSSSKWELADPNVHLMTTCTSESVYGLIWL